MTHDGAGSAHCQKLHRRPNLRFPWDGWPSGLRRTPGKCVYVNSVPWVRIPPRPSFFPNYSCGMLPFPARPPRAGGEGRATPGRLCRGGFTGNPLGLLVGLPDCAGFVFGDLAGSPVATHRMRVDLSAVAWIAHGSVLHLMIIPNVLHKWHHPPGACPRPGEGSSRSKPTVRVH
jgi:hypothetical protein